MTGLATFAGAQDEGGLKSSDVKVEFPVVQIGLMDKKGESLPVPKLIFGAMLSVPSPLNFESGDKVQEQVLTAEDSTGKKLGVVTFNLGFLGDPSRESVTRLWFTASASACRLRTRHGCVCEERSVFL